jgi:Kef-type K+ transport system membrane component KefB
MRNLAVVTESIFFRDLAYVLMAAVAGGAVARLIGQPLILGYVLGGVFISPLTPGPRSQISTRSSSSPRSA